MILVVQTASEPVIPLPRVLKAAKAGPAPRVNLVLVGSARLILLITIFISSANSCAHEYIVRFSKNTYNVRSNIVLSPPNRLWNTRM